MPKPTATGLVVDCHTLHIKAWVIRDISYLLHQWETFGLMDVQCTVAALIRAVEILKSYICNAFLYTLNNNRW